VKFVKRVCDAKSSKCPKKAGLALLSREGRVRDGPLRWVPFFFLFLFLFLSTTGHDVKGANGGV
jgi:hypothetical protein